MARTAAMEITDLAVRLEDGGMLPCSARKEAERIAQVIASESFERGYADAERKVLDALKRTEA